MQAGQALMVMFVKKNKWDVKQKHCTCKLFCKLKVAQKLLRNHQDLCFLFILATSSVFLCCVLGIQTVASLSSDFLV